jgi:hypothetical protein
MGPLAIQIRRAAEVLGYNPANLTDAQRSVALEATRDPATNMFIASECTWVTVKAEWLRKWWQAIPAALAVATLLRLTLLALLAPEL